MSDDSLRTLDVGVEKLHGMLRKAQQKSVQQEEKPQDTEICWRQGEARLDKKRCRRKEEQENLAEIGREQQKIDKEMKKTMRRRDWLGKEVQNFDQDSVKTC